jgi:hypothetical protein
VGSGTDCNSIVTAFLAGFPLGACFVASLPKKHKTKDTAFVATLNKHLMSAYRAVWNDCADVAFCIATEERGK